MDLLMNRLTCVGMLVSIGLVLGGCGSQPAASTVVVQRGTIDVTVSGNGSVEPVQSSHLTFGVAGRIDNVLVKEGQSVHEGDIIATLDPRELDQQVLQAKANVAKAEAHLQQVQNGNATDQDKQAGQAAIDAA